MSIQGIRNIAFDCDDNQALATFWASFLGTVVRGERSQFVWTGRTAGVPRLIFQQVEDAASRSGKVHLDLSTDDLEADTARALALGATVVGDIAELGINWRVLRDPEANSFCLVPLT